jgi:hypothetical protein
MALAGHGVAFLPHSAVEDAVADGSLIRLDRATRGAPAGQFTLDMEIRLYRDKLAAQGDDSRHARVSARVNAVWDAAADAAHEHSGNAGRPAKR